MSPSRPNVLLILCDQLRADHLGFGGNDVVATPSLDALVARGLRCDRAYVSNPVCMPNRSTILTGRAPSAHGTRFNGLSLDWAANTFVRELRRGGYRTGLVGKSHIQNIYSRPDAVENWYDTSRDEGVEFGYPEGWDTWEDERRHRRELVELPEDYYGFDDVQLAVNHADYASGHYYQWLRGQGIDDPMKVTGVANSPDVSPLWWQIYKPQLPAELYPTSWVGLRSVDFIERAATDPRPWMLQVSFPDPHHPFTPPGRYWDLYDPADVKVPTTFDVADDALMPHLRRWRAHRGEQKGRMSPWSPTEEQFRGAAAKEYGAITMIDDVIGTILASLERSGQTNNTLVVFTSDHGDMFGEQGIMLKCAMHYDGCARVPLVFAGPGVSAGATSSLCGSIDLASTVLSVAGIKPYEGLQGFDLRPLFVEHGATVRDWCYIEEDQPFDLLGAGLNTMVRTIITADGRLTRYHGMEHGELYDLGNDPEETANRWGDAAMQAKDRELHNALLEAGIHHTDTARRPYAMA